MLWFNIIFWGLKNFRTSSLMFVEQMGTHIVIASILLLNNIAWEGEGEERRCFEQTVFQHFQVNCSLDNKLYMNMYFFCRSPFFVMLI